MTEIDPSKLPLCPIETAFIVLKIDRFVVRCVPWVRPQKNEKLKTEIHELKTNVSEGIITKPTGLQ